MLLAAGQKILGQLAVRYDNIHIIQMGKGKGTVLLQLAGVHKENNLLSMVYGQLF